MFLLCVCTCTPVFMCALLYTNVYLGTGGCGGQRTTSGIVAQSSSTFSEIGPLIGLLVAKVLASDQNKNPDSCLCLVKVGITSMYHCILICS